MTKKELGKLIKNVRTDKGMTHLEIKHAIKVQPFQMVSIEGASSNYTIDNLLAICKHLGIKLTATIE